MQIEDLIPEVNFVQRNYCGKCGKLLDLAFSRFDEEISGIDIQIDGLPVLRCHDCVKDYLPDPTRFALIDCHKRAVAAGSTKFFCVRNKRAQEFNFAKVPFLYDPDDYFYIPGLYRQFEPPLVCRRAFVSNVRLLFHLGSRLHRTSPLLHAA